MTSITEIQAWQLCRYKHYLQYERRLEPVGGNPLMISGRALHGAIELVLSGTVPQDAVTIALGSESTGEDQFKRFYNGVERALERVPKWVFEHEWVSEELFEHTLDVGIAGIQDDDVTIRMKPDLYRVTDDTVDLVEIKTTARDPGDYLLNNPQHEWYGLGLTARYPGKVVQFQYICAPTGERDKVPIEHVPWIFTKRRMQESEEELVLAVKEMRQGRAAATNRGWWCGSCDFNKVCKARITGGNVEDVISSEYKERERHG